MAHDILNEGQLEAVRLYAERLRNQAPPEGSNSTDSALTMKDPSPFPGASTVHIFQVRKSLIVDAVQPGGKVTSYKLQAS
jgi:hypothetical protein